MNVFCFAGNLGRDAESKRVGETTVCEFSVPVEKGYGKNKKTYWIKCKLWGKRGDNLVQYLTKGTRVEIAGELGVDEWQKDGENKYMLTVDVSNINLAGGGCSRQDGDSLADQANYSVGSDVPF